MRARVPLTILGGGPAGLAVGYFASKRGLRSELFEASSRLGGNCQTFSCGEFRFDAGAHRFHDTDPEITREVDLLLGGELTRVDAESGVYSRGGMVRFPPRLFDLVRHFGSARFARMAVGTALARMSRPEGRDLTTWATHAYGPDLARYVLDYSEKLWGVRGDRLSADATGGRLRRVTLGAALGRRQQIDYFDGTFRYPTLGFGTITQRLAEASSHSTSRTEARVTRIHHREDRITHVAVNDCAAEPVERVVSTLPLDVLAGLFSPSLPQDVLRAAEALSFRDLILVAVFIDRPSVTGFASLYFPERSIPFTRVVEPRNRSLAMAPAGKTSLVAELPCSRGDRMWNTDDPDTASGVIAKFSELGLVSPNQIIGFEVRRVTKAYPILDLEAQRAAATVIAAVRRFRGLHLIGRNGLFQHTWLDALMRTAKNLVEGEVVSAAA